MRIKSIICLTLAATLLLGVAASCAKTEKGSYSRGSATIYCDEGFKNILDEEIEVFEYTYPEASIIPYYVSEVEAIDALLDGKTQAAITTRELTKEQVKMIRAKQKRIARSHCIAVDAVALVTNKDNPVATLSMEEIGAILKGEVTRWNQLGWNDTTSIKVVFDNPGSSTVKFMRDKFIGAKGNFGANIYAEKTNGEVVDIVKKNPSALGIVSVSWLGENLQGAAKVPVKERYEKLQNQNDTIATTLTTEINILKVRENDNPVGFKPYQLYINSGEYPLFRKVYMLTTASNASLVHGFYSFVTGFVGQKIISLTGIMPYNVHARVVALQ